MKKYSDDYRQTHYKRLIDRMDYCSKKMKDDDKDTDKYMYEFDCILHALDDEKLEVYETIAKFVKNKDFNKVYDIGCAQAHQSEIFLNSNLKYVGINDFKTTFWNDDVFTFISEAYPFKIDTEANDVAISVMCLTWNCYLYEGNKSLIEQLELLKRDFKHVILYIASDKIEVVSKYFKNREEIMKGLYYFNNN